MQLPFTEVGLLQGELGWEGMRELGSGYFNIGDASAPSSGDVEIRGLRLSDKT